MAGRIAWRLLWIANWAVLISFFGGLGVILGTYSSIAPMVPQLRDIAEIRITEGTRIVSAEGELLGRVVEENREFLPLEKIPQDIQDAFIAVEDRTFYTHVGVSPRGILRAIRNNLTSGSIREGGSTITQQLANNAYELTHERSLKRKLKEFILALEIERKYTKDEILELYLNEIPFGERAFGVKVAAKTFFNKEPGQLNLAECALLAGLPKAPTSYNPFRHPERAKARRDRVLAAMVETNKISREQAEEAKAEPLKLTRTRVAHGKHTFRAPYFCDYVQREAEVLLGPGGADAISRGGLLIYTTLNLEMQKEAEKLLVDGVRRAGRTFRVTQGAMAAVDTQTGAIKVMVGGLDYAESEFNRATQGNRQIGSAFKPFVYTTAIDQGRTPEDMIDDTPVSYPDGKGGRWAPKNYDRKFKGRMTLRKALALSRNVPAVKLLDQTGIDKVIEMAQRMGLRGRLDRYLPLALGTCSSTPLEMASAFSVLASGGYSTESYAITKIENASGVVLYETKAEPIRVLSESTTATMTDMLAEVIKRGTASSAARQVGGLTFPASGKTGTTSENMDAWFVGWAEGLSCAIWVGNDTPVNMGRATGGGIPAPIWMKFMKAAAPIFAASKDRAIQHAADTEKDMDRLALRSEEPVRRRAQLEDGQSRAEDADKTAGGLPQDVGDDIDRNIPADTTTADDANKQDEAEPIPPEELEMVGVCAVTGKRATYYCPRIVLKPFRKGHAPTSTCALHPDPYAER
jgi:penicillin-binding protein 1A